MTINNILIIDDNHSNNVLCQLTLKRCPFIKHTIFKTSAEAGLDYLNKIPPSSPDFPNLLLVDINLPGLNGFEFIDQLTATKKLTRHHIITYIVSTSNFKIDIDKALNNPNIDGYITKPLLKEKLEKIHTKHFSQS